MEEALIADWVRSIAATHDPRVGATTPVTLMTIPKVNTRPTHPQVVPTYLCGGVAVKIYDAATDMAELARRLEVISSPELDHFWVHPLTRNYFTSPTGDYATLWPRVTLVSTIEAPPWDQAGALLARLHTAPIDPKLPPHGGRSRLNQAIAKAKRYAGYEWLVEKGEELTQQILPTSNPRLVHGNWHLGHLGHMLLSKRWRLIDPELLGLGDPAWDLAMTAGYHHVGLLPTEQWQNLLGSYREFGGIFDFDASDPLIRAALFIATVRELAAPESATTATLLAAMR